MITEETIRAIISENNRLLIKKPTIKRDKIISTRNKSIIVISGVRRCGKSTLLQQLLKNEKHKIFLNFEDTRLEGFDLNDFHKLKQIASTEKKDCYVFDEIQNIPGWERYIRSAHDKGFRIYIIGSNASMLSRELGTKLTGRYLQEELFPYSYLEYLRFNNKKASTGSFENYMSTGEFPEFLTSEDPEYLRTLLRDIIVRDIAVRRNIRNEHTLLRLALHLMSNVGKEISYNNVTKLLGIKSVRTTIDYFGFLRESYLLDFIPRFSFSIKQQLINPKKVYAVDTGMAKANSLSFSEDYGRMLENTVYLRLRQACQDILYYEDELSECDFLLRKNDKVVYVAQVCCLLTDDNIKRKINGLKNAMAARGSKKGVIITFNQQDTFDGIEALPVWKWICHDLNFEQ